MYFKLSNGDAKKWLVLICFFTSLNSSASEINKENQRENVNKLSVSKINLSAQPANCVALRHGRTCYANVKLNWVSQIKQDYCIYIKHPKLKRSQLKVIKCWKNSNGNEVIFNFESNKKIEFQLMSSIDNKVIAETAVEVSWVHKASSRKRRWRIF